MVDLNDSLCLYLYTAGAIKNVCKVIMAITWAGKREEREDLLHLQQ